MKSLQAFTVIVLSLLHLTASAQNSNRKLSAQEQKQIIDKAFLLLRENYIFPKVIASMEPVLRKNYSEGKYANESTTELFLKHLDTDLEGLSGDPHIDVFFDPVRVQQIRKEEKDTSSKRKYTDAFLQRAQYENFRMRKVERLDGNIGYLNFLSFVDTALSKRTMQAAMDFLTNSNALIIDLRQNGGGDAAAVSFLLSYFLPDSTLIMEARNRDNEIKKTFTGNDAAINKIKDEVPVYVLTGRRTSSAAEAFAYTLQSYKRAMIIGDTTHGEANPGYLFAVNDEMYMMIPVFENINPVTKTNWQGRGVYPDVVINTEKSLTMAYAKACDSLTKTIASNEMKAMYRWMADGMFGELQPLSVNENELKAFAGNYADNRHIVFENGALYYYRGENPAMKKKLTAISKELFAVEGLSYFRIRFTKNSNGKTVALEGLYDDGAKERSAWL
jgi:retinol-binding protein 3